MVIGDDQTLPPPLRTVLCEECRLVQVDYDMPPGDLFSDYAFLSRFVASQRMAIWMV